VSQDSWREALDLMRRALAILDRAEAPGEVGAHLDLAIDRLEGKLETIVSGTPHETSIQRSVGS
jgi:hypothetical protein